METNENDGMQLNIFVGKPGNRNHPAKFTDKSRGKRIKARRQEKLTKKNSRESPSEHTEGSRGATKNQSIPSEESVDKESNERQRSTSSHSPLSGKRKAIDSEVSDRKRPKFSGPVISSLFRNNPSIPEVASVNIEKRKEELFSSEKFSELGLHAYLVSNLEEKMKLSKMTSVQQKAIPHILMGSDTMVKSQTGSGKTLVFAIPVVENLQALRPKIKRSDGPYAVVIVPSRELALQCFKTFQQLLQSFLWIVPGCIVGGENRKAEKARIRKGMNVIVGTPGRLLDHIQNTNSLSLSKVQYLIIDEADRLLEMGYEKDVAQIVSSLDKASHDISQRQTILLSATLTNDVKKLAGMSLKSAVTVDLSADDSGKPAEQTLELSETQDVDESSQQTVFSLPDKLQQKFIITPCKLRLASLVAFVMLKCKLKTNGGKMLVFMSTQDVVEFHFRIFMKIFGSVETSVDGELDSNNCEDNVETDPNVDGVDNSNKSVANINFFKLHGGMDQQDRVTNYRKFCDCDTGVLFCTDVACRGLDLPNVKWIVHYTSPGVATEYVQRAGRTARAGKVGQTLLFLMPSEVNYIKYLNDKKFSLEELQMNKLLKILPLVARDYLPNDPMRQPPRTHEEASTYIHMSFENYVQANHQIQDLAKKAFQSFVRGYSTYPSELKSVFHVKHLHLGHLAKSFALRDAPSDIHTGFKGQHAKKTKDRFSKDKSSMKRPVVSEFDSGLGRGKLSKSSRKTNIKLRNKKKK